MEFIDTHTHLYDEAFEGDYDAVVDRAVAAGISKMILPDIASSSRQDMFDLADRHPGVLYPCLGLHPEDVQDDWEAAWAELSNWQGRKIWAIGETGLDFYWSKDHIIEQEEVFRRHIRLALETELPLIIHVREATGAVLKILEEFKSEKLKGSMHAFTGSIETFREISKTGDWYFGIGGVVTFKKAGIADTVKDIPLERIILETDSPYLTPVPYRGKRNESAYIPYIAQKIADVKGISVEEVAQVTTANAKTLFNI